MPRFASAVAVIGLTVAPLALARAYGPVSLAVGVAEVTMLVSGLVLLATSFDAWGAWERLLLAIPLAWMVLIAVTMDSMDETTSARSATLSRSGSESPGSSGNRAKAESAPPALFGGSCRGASP